MKNRLLYHFNIGKKLTNPKPMFRIGFKKIYIITMVAEYILMQMRCLQKL